MREASDSAVTIRSFRSADQSACRKLYYEGLVGGKLAENDTALDLDDIAATYLNMPGSHFWVAQDRAGHVVGMIGVQHHEKDEAEIRRLRVQKEHRRRSIGTALLETALRFCSEQSYLKVTLDTFIDRESAVKLFERFYFKHQRSRKVGDRELMYFYLDLYSRDRRRSTDH